MTRARNGSWETTLLGRSGVVAFLLAACLACWAADIRKASTEPPDFRVNVQEIQIAFTAADAHAHALASLSKNDLSIVDDGIPVPAIASLTRRADQHMRLALLVDGSDSLRPLEGEKQDVLQELSAGIHHDDDVRVVSFAGRAGAASPARAITNRGSASSRSKASGTALFDAVVRAAHELNADADHPRPAMILITDGEDTNSESTIHDAVDAALKKSVAIYTIYIGDTRSMTRGQRIVEYLASLTGGRVLYPKARRDVAGLAGQLREELRSSFVVSYKLPVAADRPGSYHQLRLLPRDPKHLHLYFQAGYLQVPRPGS
jgi:VWFA-related protein